MTAPAPAHTRADTADDLTHAVCENQMDAVPRLAVCGADCTDADKASGPPYCELCIVLIRDHLAGCGTCLALFLAARAAKEGRRG